jgi:TolB-like protein
MIMLFLITAAGCATTAKTGAEPLTIAVWDVENLSAQSSSYPDLSEIFSQEIISKISEQPGIQAVERQKLLSVLEELKLGSSNLADDSSRLKIGKMLGARQMIFGSYLISGSVMRIDLRRVDCETGRVVKSSKMTTDSGDVKKWIQAAGTAAQILVK